MKSTLKKHGILTTLLVIYSSFAHADQLAAIKAANPRDTAYEILGKLYTTATAPSELSDFDILGHKSNMKCACAHIGSDSPSAVYSFVRYDLVTPQVGPLFPESRNTVLLSSALENSDAASLNKIAAGTTISFTTSDLVATFTNPDAPVDNPEIFPIEGLFRKNGNYIAFKFINHLLSPNDEVVYGYCWRQ